MSLFVCTITAWNDEFWKVAIKLYYLQHATFLWKKKKTVSCSCFAICVQEGLFTKCLLSSKNTKRYEYGCSKKYYFQVLNSITSQAYNANNGHLSITTWQNYAQTSCAGPHPTTSHHYHKPGYLHLTFRTKLDNYFHSIYPNKLRIIQTCNVTVPKKFGSDFPTYI